MYNNNTSHLPSLLSREQQKNVLKSKMDVRNGLTRRGAQDAWDAQGVQCVQNVLFFVAFWGLVDLFIG